MMYNTRDKTNIRNLIFLQCFKSEITRPLTLNIKTCATIHKISQGVTIFIICVYALNKNKLAELYIPSMFQTSNIELLSPKIET